MRIFPRPANIYSLPAARILCALLPFFPAVAAAGAVPANDPLYAEVDAGGYMAAQQHLQETLETVLSHQSRPWRAPDGEVSGTVTPLRSFKDTKGRYCREYRMEVVLQSEARSARRIACRSDVGQWVVLLR